MHMLEQNKGQDHVSAQDQAFENMSLHGSDVYLCSEYGNQLKLTMTSANQLSIDTGALLVNGRYCIIDPAETLSVDNGSSGMTEYDLVCVHWKVTSGTGTNQQEEVELAIVKGTPASSGAMDPTITNKVIKPGITEAYVPFARITKNGLTPSVELIVPELISEAKFRDSISLVDFLYTEKLSKKVSVHGSNGASFNMPFTPKSGYKPLGVIGWWCSNWEVQVPRLIINDNGQEVSGGLYNTYSGSLNPTIEAVVLFVKDE